MLFRYSQILHGGTLLFLTAGLAFQRVQAQSLSNVVARVMAANLSGNSQTYGAPQIRILQGLKPDIVAIQEFNYAGNSPTELRAFVDTAFGANFSYFRENSAYQIPNGIISRFPILDSGSWVDTVQSSPNRGFAWACLDLPGTNELYVVSVHFLTSSSANRANEAANLKTLIQSNFPANAWIIVAGDLNTSSRAEAAVQTLTTFLSDEPIPTDAESGGDPDTNEPRNNPYDYVLPSFTLTNLLTNVVIASHSFSNGLVFDSRVYAPLTEVSPVLTTDSANCQHMPVLKEFLFQTGGTETSLPPSITVQPQDSTVPLNSNASFTVVAQGSAPLSYQWRFGGANINEATTSIYTRYHVTTNDAGDYTVVITNNFGGITSSIARLTVYAAPVITNQPQGLSVNLGERAVFTVGAGGAPPLTYQWRFFGTNLPGASLASLTRTNAEIADAGDYQVVITNSYGSVTSVLAKLIVNSGVSAAIIAQWDFNSPTPDATPSTGTNLPAFGAGTASLVGGVTATFAGGSANDPASSSTDNSGWNTAAYPAATIGNKSAGIRFDVSTVGRKNIVVRWDQRVSNTGSKYSRLQYTTNGAVFWDFPSAIAVTAPTNYEPRTNNLSSLPGANDNPHFGFRLVSEFEITATGSDASSYVAAASGSSYGPAGTVRFDLVTVLGDAIAASNPPPAAPMLGIASVANGSFEFLVSGSAGTNYVLQASTNLSANSWISLETNASPFAFQDTNTALFPQRFYRAVAPR